ncbi:MAG: hypothetical protein HRT68_05125 [Flavobacteriaceae bacterium]|nr:hypothetical protein [Flavobacteriaceae bacterium]
MNKSIKLKFPLIIGIAAILMASCVSLYDHYTYTETIETKVQTLSLMDQSSGEYNDHEAEIIALQNQIKTMLEYEKGKSKNKITVKMWEVLSDDNKLIGSYLKLWKDKGKLSPVFIDEAKPQIEEAFDVLIKFELDKDKTSEDTLRNFINNI